MGSNPAQRLYFGEVFVNQLKIKRLYAKNFMCFGEEGIEINLNQFGNIVLVRGENWDTGAESQEERVASNGVGKSAIAEILIYGLFGKTIKNPKKVKHENCINNQIGKGLKVVVEFDDLRVTRTRVKDTLLIEQFGGPCPSTNKPEEWKSDDWNSISLGGIPATQEWLNNKLELTYETFVNLAIFTDNNAGAFLEVDTPTKREIVENVLVLSRYRGYWDHAKKLRNVAKDQVKDHARVLELALAEFETAKRRIQKIEQQQVDWKTTKQTELATLVQRIKGKQAELGNTDTGAALAKYNAAQDKIVELSAMQPEKEERLAKYKNGLEEFSKKQEELKASKDASSLRLNTLKADLSRSKSTIKDNERYISDIEAQRCKKCQFTDENGLLRATNILGVEKAKVIDLEQKIVKEEADLDKYTKNLSTATTAIKGAENKVREIVNELDIIRKEIISLSKVEKPEISINEKLIEEQISELKNQALAKKAEIDGPSPFIVILQEAEEESKEKEKNCEIKKDVLDKANKQLPYYEFWVTAFGDNGIRKFIIDGIIPALNQRVAHWLQFLIDGKIKLSFDNQLEETIERNPSDGDPFVYHAMSGGERRRLNLAVSQAFAHIMMLNSGTSPSLVFLDEVTTNVDPIGVQGVYNMIVEIAKEKQVFVTTHDHDLLDLLAGCETINLRKQNGFTTMV